MNKLHSPQWQFGQNFQILEQEYAKTEMIGGFDTAFKNIIY